MFRLYNWICVTWQSYPALLPSSLILIIPDKQVCVEELCQTDPNTTVDMYASVVLFHFHNHELVPKKKKKKKLL